MTADHVLETLRAGGHAAYFGEPVTQREHALQTAALAERAGAPDALVAAALLHDVGHLLHGMGEAIAGGGIDARHEELAYRWLSTMFGPATSEPVRLHVPAKRYLCAIEPTYGESLSAVSQESLTLQGGPMTPEEARAFEQVPWARDAVALRRWDDLAKVPGHDVPGLAHYRARVEAALGSGSAKA